MLVVKSQLKVPTNRSGKDMYNAYYTLTLFIKYYGQNNKLKK